MSGGGPTELIRQNCPPATLQTDGYMTKEQVALLDAAGGGGGTSWQYVVAPGDNDDFIVSIPADKQPATADYVATMVIQSGSIFTLYRIPYANQATNQLRVLTDGTLAVGTLLGFTLTEV